eukprot:scaffold28649_cov111-Isochrysis_galbana.AAC.4
MGSAPVKTSLRRADEKPDSSWVLGSSALAGKPQVLPRRFQKMMRGAAYGSPQTARPTSANRSCSRSRCVFHICCGSVWRSCDL